MKFKLKKVALLVLITSLLAPSFGTLSAQETLSSDYEEEMQLEVMEAAPEFEQPIPEIEEITETTEESQPLESISPEEE